VVYGTRRAIDTAVRSGAAQIVTTAIPVLCHPHGLAVLDRRRLVVVTTTLHDREQKDGNDEIRKDRRGAFRVCEY